MANSEFLQAFEDYKIAVANGDTAQQETLAGKFRPLLFYAQNDTDHDEIAEVLEAYHNTLALEAQNEFDETGAVTNPLFQLIYEEYASNLDKGSAQVKIDATFVIRGAKGVFENTSYQSKVVDNRAYSYLKLKTQNGKLAITGVKQGKYVIPQLSTVRDNYNTDGFQKLYTNFGGNKKIVDSTKTESLEYDGKTYTGSVVDVTESGTASLNYFDFIKINYPYGTLEVNKTAKAPVPDAEETPVDAAFRLVGITKDASHPMKSGQADDPAADGGHNFMTESGHARITKLLPGDYVLYEYRKGQSYTDKDGETYEMEDGCKEYDTNPSSDKSKLLEVYRFTVKAGKEGTSASFVAKVSNVLLPSLALIKLDGEEFDTLYKDYATNNATREELLTFFSDREGFQTEIDASFLLTGISLGASYPDGKLFDTMQNVCLITDLEPGTYEVQEQGIISANQDQYEVNRKTYEIELTEQYTKENPYLIVHPNYKDRPIFADLVLNKIDNMAFFVSDVTFSCAAYIGEYTEGYYDNKLSQKNNENQYMGKEFYAEGTVKNGYVSFENIKVDVDEDNYVTTWLHLHEIAGKLEIHKVDSKDGKKAVGGVIFDLYREDGSEHGILIETLETDENGIAFSSSLYQGNYFYIEKKAPPNYWVDATPHPFIVNQTNMGVIKSVITNDLVELNIRVHKMDDKKRNLAGVGFTLFDKDGKALTFTQVVDEAGTTQEVSEFFTNEDGMLIFPQKVGYGKYTLKETTTPPKYKKADDITITIDSNTKYVEIEAIGKTVTCEVINYPKIASIKIVKKDKDTALPLSGVEFLVTCEENNYSQTFVTNAEGEIVITNLEAGTYIFTETKPKDGYLGTTPDGKPITGTIVITEDGKEYVVLVENQKPEVKPGTCKVRKLDKESKVPLLGAIFYAKDEEGNLISSQTSGADGYAVFEGLMPGKTYFIEEMTPPTGYELAAPSKVEITIREGETKEIVFENVKMVEEKGSLTLIKKGEKEVTFTYVNEKVPELENPGDMWITKVDAETEKPLAGVIFRVLNLDKEEVMRAVTDSMGNVKFTLDEGNYYYQEVKAPNGYQLDEKMYPFTIKKGETVQVTVKNKKICEKFGRVSKSAHFS